MTPKVFGGGARFSLPACQAKLAEGKLKHNAARFSKVGRTPWSAAGPLAGNASMIHEAAPIDEERVQGDPCGPGGPPYFAGLAAIFGKNERH
jgi:hypothetical protein